MGGLSARRILGSLPLAAATLALAVGVAAAPLAQRAAAPRWAPGQAGEAGRLRLTDGLPILELQGDAEARGRAAAALTGAQAAELFSVMRWNPRLALADAGRLASPIAAEDRAEIAAFAAAAGLDPGRLLAANAILETLCTAAVHVPSALVARNMDFFPPLILARHTVIQVVRAPGRLAYAAVGWPGMVGVISGMNEAGLAACVLLNWLGADPGDGEPLALRVRRLLQACRTVDEAWSHFAASPVGSEHFVLVADPRDAAVLWWTPQGPRRDDPGDDGWLFASNWPRAGARPRSDDRRGVALAEACLAAPRPEPAALRRALAAAYLRGLNAQAMIFDLAARRLELALAEPGRPAARARTWRIVELAPLLEGRPAAVEPPRRD